VRGPQLTEVRAHLAVGAPVLVDPPAGLEDGRRIRVEDRAPVRGAAAATSAVGSPARAE
jgi:hypothetical protein